MDLVRMLGLDRAPEVKTLRRKLTRLARSGGATLFGHLLAERCVEALGATLGFLYVDGHVRVYHGQRDIPKAHVARMRTALPATTDYWANDARSEPLFVVTADANAGMVAMLPKLLEEVRALVGERRVTVVFYRGGWSPKLFADLVAAGFDFLTYRKDRFRRLPRRCFGTYTAVVHAEIVHPCGRALVPQEVAPVHSGRVDSAVDPPRDREVIAQDAARVRPPLAGLRGIARQGEVAAGRVVVLEVPPEDGVLGKDTQLSATSTLRLGRRTPPQRPSRGDCHGEYCFRPAFGQHERKRKRRETRTMTKPRVHTPHTLTVLLARIVAAP